MVFLECFLRSYQPLREVEPHACCPYSQSGQCSVECYLCGEYWSSHGSGLCYEDSVTSLHYLSHSFSLMCLLGLPRLWWGHPLNFSLDYALLKWPFIFQRWLFAFMAVLLRFGTQDCWQPFWIQCVSLLWVGGPLPVLSQPKRGSSSWLSQPHADVPTDSELNCTAPRRQPLRSCLGPSPTVFRESLESWHLWQNTVKCCSLPHMLIKEGESGFGAQLSMMAKHYLFFMNNRRHLACS